MPLRLLNWNVEWAEPKWKAAEIERRIDQYAADIVYLNDWRNSRPTRRTWGMGEFFTIPTLPV